jgi:hypothetical protein
MTQKTLVKSEGQEEEEEEVQDQESIRKEGGGEVKSVNVNSQQMGPLCPFHLLGPGKCRFGDRCRYVRS